VSISPGKIPVQINLQKLPDIFPGWALGLSLYATFLSSNTFLGVPGKSFGSDWNSFVFSLSMPLAAWVACEILRALSTE
jgi:Na+/proline symporter